MSAFSVPSIPSRPAPPVRYVEIRFGDTLQDIALRELGTAAKWLDLVVLNDLRPPYLDAAAALGVLAYGSLIQIPAAISVISADVDAADLYGTDIVAADDGSLPVAGGDFMLVSGVPNLRAALSRRVLVEKRELAFHPEYGCYVRRLIGKVNGPTAGQLAAFYVKSSLLEDSRVQDVPSCSATVAGDQIKVSATVLPITGKPTDLEVLI